MMEGITYQQSKGMITRPTFSEKVYSAIQILSLDHDYELKLLKSRYTTVTKKPLSVNESINIMADMLCKMLYNGSMELFQEGMKIKITEAIRKTIIEGGVDARNVQRESISNGARHGSSL